MSPKMRLSFAPTAEVKFIPALSDTGESEKKALWYNDDDYDEMKKSAFNVVRSMRKGRAAANSDDDSMCTWGLEQHRSQAHSEQRQINKDFVIKAVLDEQERQWTIGTCGVDEISQASITHSRWARDLALADGMSYALSLTSTGQHQSKRLKICNEQATSLLEEHVKIFDSEKCKPVSVPDRSGEIPTQMVRRIDSLLFTRIRMSLSREHR
mmetsp:Transcript_16720/g.31313  ORF Transcript_16720/g.31313 Transcript_16720/m.31313 type:complete len:211 (-) Transcript_16720:208-840(-)|eukprot:CAMPEP_0197456314 /NCGR_PEP_ID=MMETSP1175-20131217/43020_1 /TAXON_ID=1003142 /ORGANISM="Triceratium dubium, Strain CCMP147" /LENGTH=210 /DNA_ID=CAMNT_0042990361 /DNA_START=145 /DNA_END=777 /DNA_ORIENTATION=+